MQIRNLAILTIMALIFSTTSSFALIKIDDNSVDLAIKYGINSKGTQRSRDLLGSNWLNDGTGRILNIYSPFIQIAVKAVDQNSTGNIDEDIKTIKKRLETKIIRVKTKNEIRFIVNLYGDTEDFAQNSKAYVISTDKYSMPGNEKARIKTKKISAQKIADKDDFMPDHPYSAVNCYTFRFDDLFKLKEYFFVITSEKGEQVKYRINNEEIF